MRKHKPAPTTQGIAARMTGLAMSILCLATSTAYAPAAIAFFLSALWIGHVLDLSNQK